MSFLKNHCSDQYQRALYLRCCTEILYAFWVSFWWVSGVRQGSTFILLHIDSQLSQHLHWGSYLFPAVCSWRFAKDELNVHVGIYFSILFLWFACTFYATTTLFWLRSLCNLKSGNGMLPGLSFLLKIALATWVVCGSTWILDYFIPFLWKMPLGFRQGLH